MIIMSTMVDVIICLVEQSCSIVVANTRWQYGGNLYIGW